MELTSKFTEATGALPDFDVPVQRLPLAAFDLYNPFRRRRIKTVLHQSGADVVLLNLPSAEYGATPLLVRGTGVPVVGLMHISGTMGELGFRLGRLRESLARRAVSRLDSILLLSDEAGNRYRKQWRPQGTELNVFSTPLPRIEPVDSARSRDHFDLPPKPRLIGIIGRLTAKQKGHDTFVEAAARMSRERSDLDFVVVGDGQDRARIEDMVSRMGLARNFHFLGRVADIAAVLSAIDLIAIPSRFEGLPLVALEALAAGVPGVASSVDGLCDVWPANWRIAPGDADRLALLLLDLLDDEPARRKLVEDGRMLMRDRTTTNPGTDVAECLVRTVSRG
ncbi:MAG: glycosyltransferase [Solirubrobacterales bacterium]|nr:glycosyltransferase [Solirubrobacterales bacterium]